jgi:hypothetical protein
LLYVKVNEEHCEGDQEYGHDVKRMGRKVAVTPEESIAHVEENQEKLKQLDLSDVLLPPKKRLDSVSTTSKTIVSVHDDMHE